MAIQRNAGGGGNFIREPGEYKVRVHEIKTAATKEKKLPMLVVTFQSDDEKLISDRFVKSLPFRMKALEELKVAAGLKLSDHQDELLGKEVGILVELQDPTPDGKVFTQITGYGKASDVAAPPAGDGSSRDPGTDDRVPF